MYFDCTYFIFLPTDDFLFIWEGSINEGDHRLNFSFPSFPHLHRRSFAVPFSVPRPKPICSELFVSRRPTRFRRAICGSAFYLYFFCVYQRSGIIRFRYKKLQTWYLHFFVIYYLNSFNYYFFFKLGVYYLRKRALYLLILRVSVLWHYKV